MLGLRRLKSDDRQFSEDTEILVRLINIRWVLWT